jgi:PPM family protein phosphatase
MTVIVATRIERGSAGEDRVAIDELADRTIIIVADGAGGTGSGARAAELLCAHTVDSLRGGGDPSRALVEGDRLLHRTANGGEAAAVAIVIAGNQIIGASVGDSEAWLITDEGVVDLTEQQRRKPLLGSGRAEPVAFGPVGLHGRLLVGTDGLFKYASLAEIVARAREDDLERAVERLVDVVRSRSGCLLDDVAITLCQ